MVDDPCYADKSLSHPLSLPISLMHAAKLRDHMLYVAEDQRPDLGEHEYLVADLVGLKAYLDPAQQTYVGEVVGVVMMDDLGIVAAKGQVRLLVHVEHDDMARTFLD